jgi:hypothetical protein
MNIIFDIGKTSIDVAEALCSYGSRMQKWRQGVGPKSESDHDQKDFGCFVDHASENITVRLLKIAFSTGEDLG